MRNRMEGKTAHVIDQMQGIINRQALDLSSLRFAARHLLDMIEAQGRDTTPAPKVESIDDANSRNERDQVFGDAIMRLAALLPWDDSTEGGER